jgi:hypothetical protein
MKTELQAILSTILISASALFAEGLDMSKYSDLKIDKEFLPMLATMPLQMELGGAKLFRGENGSIWIVSIGMTDARQATSGELLRRQTVAKDKAQANAVAALDGESVKAVASLKDKVVTGIENGVENAVSEETLKEAIVSEARGLIKGMPVVGSWLSLDGKLFYVAIGHRIDQSEKKKAVNEIKHKDAAPNPDAKLIAIKASGSGKNEDDATKRALQSAVEQAIGLLMYSKRTIEDEEIALEKIDFLSNGFVKSYKKLTSKKEGDQWEVSIDAIVQNGAVADFLRTEGIESKVDLQNKWAQLTTGLNAKKQAIDLYEAKIQEIKSRLFSAKLVDLKTGLVAQSIPTPYIEDDLDGNATCLWAVKIEPDLEFWNECAYPLLAACFQTLSVGRKTIRVRYLPASRALSSVLGGKTPKYLPPLLRVADPKLPYLSGSDDPGLHVSLFLGEQHRPYQGELVYEGQTNLYCVILEKPVHPHESLITAYFLKQEVIDRLFPKNNRSGSWSRGMEDRNYLDSWTLDGFITSAHDAEEDGQVSVSEQISPGGSKSSSSTIVTLHDDGNYSSLRSLSDQLNGIIGAPVTAHGISPRGGPLYFGPWIQCNGGNYSSNGVSEWPIWKDLSCYSRPREQGWGINVIHDGKMYPLNKNFGNQPPPFVRFMYLPLIFEMPVDMLPKIKEIDAFLTVKSVEQE